MRSGEYRLRETGFGPPGIHASAQPHSHNPRKQRKNPAAAGLGERFREGKWRSGRDRVPTFSACNQLKLFTRTSIRPHFRRRRIAVFGHSLHLVSRVSLADKADLCTCGYCWRSIYSLLQYVHRCIAVSVARAVIDNWCERKNPYHPFAANRPEGLGTERSLGGCPNLRCTSEGAQINRKSPNEIGARLVDQFWLLVRNCSGFRPFIETTKIAFSLYAEVDDLRPVAVALSRPKR